MGFFFSYKTNRIPANTRHEYYHSVHVSYKYDGNAQGPGGFSVRASCVRNAARLSSIWCGAFAIRVDSHITVTRRFSSVNSGQSRLWKIFIRWILIALSTLVSFLSESRSVSVPSVTEPRYFVLSSTIFLFLTDVKLCRQNGRRTTRRMCSPITHQNDIQTFWNIDKIEFRHQSMRPGRLWSETSLFRPLKQISHRVRAVRVQNTNTNNNKSYVWHIASTVPVTLAW